MASLVGGSGRRSWTVAGLLPAIVLSLPVPRCTKKVLLIDSTSATLVGRSGARAFAPMEGSHTSRICALAKAAHTCGCTEELQPFLRAARFLTSCSLLKRLLRRCCWVPSLHCRSLPAPPSTYHAVVAKHCPRCQTPQQGFPTSSSTIPPGRTELPRASHNTQDSAIMASIFRRIYDWLLRLFWYASCSSVSVPLQLWALRRWLPICSVKFVSKANAEPVSATDSVEVLTAVAVGPPRWTSP